MKSNFDFKSLLKRLPSVKIPKEFIYFGIGMILLIIIGLIVSNMYLQEMIFNEGIEKTTPLYTEEELREYGALYKELEIAFEEEIASKIQTYANRTNRKGENIRYGVYGQYNSDDLLNDDFVDGVTIKYAKTPGRKDGESNFQDILSVVAILIDQRQSKSEEENKRLIRSLYNLSHTFTGVSTDLYPCVHGCFCDYYHCSDIADNPIYDHCNIKYQPFSIEPHGEYDDYSEEDFTIIEPIGVCEVDSEIDGTHCYNQRGCVQEGICYHGPGGNGSRSEDGDMGRTEPVDMCSNYSPNYDCDYDGDGEHDCSDNPIGCAGFWQCNGHEHYHCPNGHFYVCCMGHTNITISIRIMYLNEIVEELKK